MELAMEEDELKAFWLNLFNSLIFHAIITFGVPTDSQARYDITSLTIYRKDFFHSASYIIGGQRYSLSDIEALLRSNRAPPPRLGRFPFPRTIPDSLTN